MTAPALEVRDLRVRFDAERPGAAGTLAVDGVSFAIARGEAMALIGESGSGKSATLLAIAGLLPPTARATGEALLNGRPILGLPERERRAYRGRGIGMVFQDPGGSLNPVLTVGDQLDEVVAVHLGLRGRAARAETLALMTRVGIADAEARARAYPHQLSGGLKQRVAIAAALAPRPALILADEPTTALDATVQAQILDLLVELVDREGVALLMVTHDLAVAAAVAHRIAVAYAGLIVEERSAEGLIARPAHPYSHALGQAALPFAPTAESESERLPELPGRMAAAGGVGCAFAPRCPLALPRHFCERPPLEPYREGRAACWRAGEISG